MKFMYVGPICGGKKMRERKFSRCENCLCARKFSLAKGFFAHRKLAK